MSSVCECREKGGRLFPLEGFPGEPACLVGPAPGLRPIPWLRALDATAARVPDAAGAGSWHAGARRPQEAPRDASEGCFGFTGTCGPSLLVPGSRAVCASPWARREVGAPRPFAPMAPGLLG